MEMKVWLDGYQRVVCGVTEQTTCQDVMIALAHASGKTGRFTMIEKWRSNERCLSPTDFPLVLLQQWGEYSSDVQLILSHSHVGTGRKHRNQPGSGLHRPASSLPEHVPVKKSLTFSGAHAGSADRSAAPNGRVANCSHSVESSEQGSVASQSSASLSPYMSLERTQRAEGNLSNGDLEKDFRMRRIWSPDHLKQGSDDATAEGNPSKVPSQSPVPVGSRSQVPVPSVRSSKATGGAEVGSQIPKLAQRKEALALEPRQQNGGIVLETKRFHSNAPASRNPQILPNSHDTLNAVDSNKTSMSSRTSSVSSNVSSNVSWKTPAARDKNDNLVSDSGPSVPPLKLPTVKPSDLSRSTELQKGPRKETLNHPKEISWSEPGLGRERPVAAKRYRGHVCGNHEGAAPLRTDSPGSNVTHSVEASAMSRPTVNQAPSSTPVPSVEVSATSRPTWKQAPSSSPAPSVEASVMSRPMVKQAPSSSPAPSVEASVMSRPMVKQAPSSTPSPSVEAQVTSRVSTVFPLPQGPGSVDVDQLKEAKEKKELIDLIGRQEREMLKCESRLKDLNSEISVLENDLEVDERQLESQMRKIEELEGVERQLEEELVELELVSWEDKLVLEKQKENRIRTEILLLQSSIAKSEAEILSFVEKIRSLTIKTEEATQELNRSLEKKEKENRDIEDLESCLSRAMKDSMVSKSALRLLEVEISTADRTLSRKKEDLAELEGQLKKLNLEFFLQEPREIASTRRSRGSVLERLGVSRPGSSRRLQRCNLSTSPLRLNRTVDETDRPALGYIV